MQELNNRVRTSSYSRVFRVSAIFDNSMYLVNVNVKKLLIAMTRFRLSSHPLRIETGRGLFIKFQAMFS